MNYRANIKVYKFFISYNTDSACLTCQGRPLALRTGQRNQLPRIEFWPACRRQGLDRTCRWHYPLKIELNIIFKRARKALKARSLKTLPCRRAQIQFGVLIK